MEPLLSVVEEKGQGTSNEHEIFSNKSACISYLSPRGRVRSALEGSSSIAVTAVSFWSAAPSLIIVKTFGIGSRNRVRRPTAGDPRTAPQRKNVPAQ
jgi:hypothetical protein